MYKQPSWPHSPNTPTRGIHPSPPPNLSAKCKAFSKRRDSTGLPMLKPRIHNMPCFFSMFKRGLVSVSTIFPSNAVSYTHLDVYKRQPYTMSREVLPKNVTPLHYDITLEPDFQAFTFEGSLRIDLQINDHSINFVQVNCLEIDFNTARIEGISAIEVDKSENQQTATFVFPDGTFESLGPSAELKISFTGILNDQMAGFYRAKYTDKATGEMKYMATTQMEATDARRAFPCFDEPNLKATFAVTLISEPFLTHLSNMDVKAETVKEGKKYTTFNTTPKMSTYLVAFIVADLRYVESLSLIHI